MDLRDKLSSLSISPQKILKIVIGLSVVLLLMWLFTLSQIDSTEDTGNREVFNSKQTVDTLSTASDSSKSETQAVNRYSESSDIFTNGLLTFFILVIILAIIWFWIDRSGGTASGKKGRQLDSQVLGEGAQLKIIRMNNEVWVLGVTSHSVNLLHQYADDEWQETIAKDKAADRDTFANIFRSKI